MLRYVALKCYDRLACALLLAVLIGFVHCMCPLPLSGRHGNLKPQLNDGNSSQQPMATLLTQDLQAPGACQTKRLQYFDATYRNTVGRNILRAFDHPVATCYDML